MSFGERLLESRNAKGWTLDDVAKRTKITAPYLSKIEREEVLPRRETLRGIARKLDVDPIEVVADRDKEELKRLGRDPDIADVMIDLELLEPKLRTVLLDRLREELAELKVRHDGGAEPVLEPRAARAR
jgi:transcriptional regulator with XRE-family HTH domain